MKPFEVNINDVSIIQFATTAISAISLFFITPDLTDLAMIFVGYFLYSCIGMTIFYHRYWSHHSFKTNKIIETVGTIFGALAGRGSALSWITIHRLHHKHADTEDDPHWSKKYGWKIFFPYMIDYNLKKVSPFMIKDLLNSKINMLIHEYYYLFLIPYLVILGLIDLKLLLYFWIFPVALTAWALNLFVYSGHVKDQSFVDKKVNARNSLITSLLLWGEGWHVIHHENPSKYRQHWFDPAGWVISLIRTKDV